MNPPIKAWLRGDPPERTPLSGREFALEKLMTGLRTLEGVDLGQLRAATEIDVATAFPDALGTALRHELLVLEGTRLRATRAGVRVLNAVLRGFFGEGG
jgi:coproporphyrinogen III oxidase-like Fe-S oxidoreductase